MHQSPKEKIVLSVQNRLLQSHFQESMYVSTLYHVEEQALLDEFIPEKMKFHPRKNIR